MIKQFFFSIICTLMMTSCEKIEVSYPSERRIIMEDTLFFEGTIVHHKHINASSGVLIITIDTANVLKYNGIYGSIRDGSGFGLITPDTAFVITDAYHKIITNKNICFKNGYWLIDCSDRLKYSSVNNIVGSFDKSKKYISRFRNDGILNNQYYLRDFIFLVWAPIIMFILFAIAFKIMKVKI